MELLHISSETHLRPSPPRAQYMFVEVAEVLALAERAGAKIVKPAQDVFWGGYHGYFSDLDGYYWEVAWAPMCTFDQTGALVFKNR